MSTNTLDIELSAPVNLRDLGGIPVAGGLLREKMAIRTDDLAYVTDQVATQLVADGLDAIIDLRSPLEVTTTGRGPLGSLPVNYHHLPLLNDIASQTPGNPGELTHEAMGGMYLGMIENCAPQLVTALNIIAFTKGTTAFHCAAGRDRTGVLAAVLLLALGASDQDIITDYARTGNNMPAIMERNRPVMGAMWKALGIDVDQFNADGLLQGGMEISMRSTLTALRERHGDPLRPLLNAGLSADTIAALRGKALSQ
ncbi:tyrosine-protein phosphatase [Glutamicibacter sp. NPDC087344]|uniref:tyrosine-protein phosphatase n=1 Tax=Glutamicibacter sp. NPDC087344 TaxID=3363994 RepID=UPI00380D3487